ncbi:MAG: LON peptidase substrate-binding domain-containing protein [Acidobacteria bacterium]|nr:LON peptidase substrate-binding domain-containing protein [Acidobacteriota bacterium]
MAAPPRPAAALPAVLPVFPLTGSLLLPGNWLPLNVFEPRYRNLVEDSTGGKGGGGERGGGADPGSGGVSSGGVSGSSGGDRGERWIGMIQPRVPHQDNWPALEEPPARPELYAVGCAGRIERCEPQPDGRYLILLKGVSRFRVRRELPLRRGYRRVEADYSEFAADRDEAAVQLDPAPLLRAVRAFGAARGLELDLDVLAALPGVSLLNGLAVALPFRPAEKQALLEAAGPHDRERILLALMGMGIEPFDPGEHYAPPTVH